MRKRYEVKPVTEIELAFPERTLLLRFDAAAVFHAEDLEGGIVELMKNKNITELCAKIIYMGACEQEKGFTIEDAKKIVTELDLETAEGIISDFLDSLGAGETIEETQKKTIMECLEKMALK